MAILWCVVWRLLHPYYAMSLTFPVFHACAFIDLEYTQLIPVRCTLAPGDKVQGTEASGIKITGCAFATGFV
jgi:hypothetical protein